MANKCCVAVAEDPKNLYLMINCKSFVVEFKQAFCIEKATEEKEERTFFFQCKRDTQVFLSVQC